MADKGSLAEEFQVVNNFEGGAVFFSDKSSDRLSMFPWSPLYPYGQHYLGSIGLQVRVHTHTCMHVCTYSRTYVPIHARMRTPPTQR